MHKRCYDRATTTMPPSSIRFITLGSVLLLGSAAAFQTGKDDSFTSKDLDDKLASYYESFSLGTPITKRIQSAGAQGKEPVVVTYRGGGYEYVQHVDSRLLPQGIPPMLLSEIDNADLIVAGEPVKRQSLMIADGSFLFSEYLVEVKQVLLDNKNQTVAGDNIVVVRQGGLGSVQGKKILATDPAFELFRLNSTYLFLLRAVPGANAYQASPSGTFRIDSAGSVVPGLKDVAPGTFPDHKDQLFSDLESGIAYILSNRR
jgi:hypothetical protein